jgi:hypothetical protein
MTKEQLAELLDGREYGSEITSAEEKAAKLAGLLVVFGASDDLCELRGVIEDEAGAYDGTTVLIGRDGKLLPEMEDDDEEILKKHGVFEHVLDVRRSAIRIEALWDSEGYSWVYETKTPHATFEVLEDGGKYCRGIVIDLKPL